MDLYIYDEQKMINQKGIFHFCVIYFLIALK